MSEVRTTRRPDETDRADAETAVAETDVAPEEPARTVAAPEKAAPEKAAAERMPSQIRIVDAPLVEPSGNLGLLSVFERTYLLRLLVRREIQSRYAGSVMGLFWSYINPLSQFFIYWFVMGHVMGAGRTVENYPVHVFSGMIVVHFFTETFGSGTRSIVHNKPLINRLALPKEMFPVSAMLVSFYHVLPASAILIPAAFATGWRPDIGTLFGVSLGLAIIMVLGTALALMFSVANVFFRDFGSAVMIISNFVRFGVPMVYSYTQISHKFGHFATYYMMNPIANAVLLFQRAFWVRATPNPAATLSTQMPPHLWRDGFLALAVSIGVLIVAQRIFNKYENRIPERL